jgi:hypothetical protein
VYRRDPLQLRHEMLLTGWPARFRRLRQSGVNGDQKKLKPGTRIKYAHPSCEVLRVTGAVATPAAFRKPAGRP